MRRLFRALFPVALFALVSSCGLTEPEGSTKPDPRLARLDAQHQQWLSDHIAHYTMEFVASCFCAGEFTEPVIVEVVNDSITSVVVRETGLPVQYPPADAWLTVEELFDAVRGAIENDAAELEVRYDPDLGYPDFVFIDRDATTIDDEVGYTVFGLAVVR